MGSYGGRSLKLLVTLHLFVALTLYVVAFRGGTMDYDIPDFQTNLSQLTFWSALLLIIASSVIGICLLFSVYQMITYGVMATPYSRGRAY